MMQDEILIGIVSGVGVIAIAGVGRILWKFVSSHQSRSHVIITLHLSNDIVEAPFSFFLFRVREGPDAAPLINKAQKFRDVEMNLRVSEVSFPLVLGLQFHCFADWTEEVPPSLEYVTSLFEENGWRNIGIDGLRRNRFWFILSEYATK